MVDVLIVNYRTPELTVLAVTSVLAEPGLGMVWVVDNASGEADQAYLKERLDPKKVTLICSRHNVGFGQANNLAAERSTAQYIFLLNSDAQLVSGSLEKLVKVLEDNPTVGVVAPAVYLDDRISLQLDAQGIFPTADNILFQRTKQPDTSLFPDWLSGVAMLARREEFVRLGGFAKGYFMYYEDVDLCYRYRKLGKSMRKEPSAGVIHLGGRSSNNKADQKKAYDAAQDLFLRRIGTPFPMRTLVVAVRFLYRLVTSH